MKKQQNLKMLITLSGLLAISGIAQAQSTVVNAEQVLGTVEVFCPTCAIDMKFDDPERLSDFEILFTDPDADFVSCVRVPAGDFLCLDKSDKTVKSFPGTSPATLDPVFSCTDAALDLNVRKANTCTAYTYGLDAHFLAGVNNGKTFSLQRIFEDSACSNWLADGVLCAEELYTGRPLLLDIKPVQDELAELFPYGGGNGGIVGIEQRSDTVFFPVPALGEPVVIANKKDWGLKGKQTLQGVDILQINNPVAAEETVDNYAVVTTSTGKILAIEIDGATGVIDAYDIAGSRSPDSIQCNFDDQHYGLKVDEKTDFTILTDRNFCQATALKAVLDDGGKLVEFVPVTETVDGLTSDLVLTAGESGTLTEGPLGPTTSPGKNFDLRRDCEESPDGCTFITGSEGAAAATLQDVIVVSEEAGVTVFQAKQIPFCPYKPIGCLTLLDPDFEYLPTPTKREQALTELENMGVLDRVPGATSLRPEEYAFNVTPVLPQEILDRFNDSGDPAAGGLPPLWMLPDMRARIKYDFVFEALFFVTEARTSDVLTLELAVAELEGVIEDPLQPRCETLADLPPGFVGVDRLLQWDVATRASERDPTIDGPQSPADANYQGTLVNAGCGSTRLRSSGISIFPYNLEASGCPGTYDAGGNLVFDTDGTCVLGDRESAPGSYDEFGNPNPPETADDAVFAKAYVRYYDELLAHLDELLCEESAAAILQQEDCGLLRATWFNGDDKLVKALDATISPKTSAGSQNFGAVKSQFDNYRSLFIDAQSRAGEDLRNRIGEHAARLETLEHILTDKVGPSIPPTGFVENNRNWAEPWPDRSL